jgi:methionyl aminopeptidase
MNLQNFVRTEEELELMRKSGQITALALKKTIEAVKPGVSLFELDQIAEKEMRDLDASASFKTVPGYDFATCMNVNDEVVHGIPRKDVILKEGDVLKIDLGALYKSWHTDSAWTVVVGGDDNKKWGKFLSAGEEAMWAGVKNAVVGNHIGDISSAMQTVIERNGLTVVRSLAGHGVGRAGHEEPEVPGFGTPKTGEKLLENMTLAIEIIYTDGGEDMYTKEDNWTLATDDGSTAGLFEMSVIVKEGKAEVLTDWRKF